MSADLGNYRVRYEECPSFSLTLLTSSPVGPPPITAKGNTASRIKYCLNSIFSFSRISFAFILPEQYFG